ncbi:hypothetical protein U1Q18_030991, partial [Sarracenia purpurea var. burkii]
FHFAPLNAAAVKLIERRIESSAREIEASEDDDDFGGLRWIGREREMEKEKEFGA